MRNISVNSKSIKLHFDRQRGNMMLNSIIALIISAIVTTAGYLGFKYVEDAKVDNEISEISSLKASTIMLAQGRGTDSPELIWLLWQV